MADVAESCLRAFRDGDKENVLRFLPNVNNPQDIRDHAYYNWTLVHWAAWSGWDVICSLLVKNYDCDPTICTPGGFSPLHVACIVGSVPTVQYLITIESVLRSINDKTEYDGYTPLHWACLRAHLPVIEFLLSTPSVSITEKNSRGLTPIELLRKYSYVLFERLASRIDWNTELLVQSYFKVIMTCNTAAGKTTLAAVMVELASHAPSQHGRVSGVETLTAGVCPTQCNGVFQLRENRKKWFGRVYGSRVTEHIRLDSSIEIFDLAGQSEYYSSHAAVLESLCLESPAVFVIMVDLTKSEDQLSKEIYSWSNFLKIHSSGISSHVIVTGSRKDKFSLKSQLLASKCKHVEDTAKKALEDQHFAGFVALDSRQLSSENAQPFLHLLTKSINELTMSGAHKKMSFACHLLHIFLNEIVQDKAISFDSLQKLVSSDTTLSRLSDPATLSSTLVTLADKGLLLFLRDSNHLASSCIVIDKKRLLQEINGTLFAPRFFKEHRPIASNTGIAPVSLLHHIFPHYNRDMLVALMMSLQFCRPVDPALLDSVTTNLSAESATSEQLLYFPALVSAERPRNLIITEGSGWFVYCTNPHECLTSRYQDSLMLDLAYNFCPPLPAPPKIEHPNESVVRKLNRTCTVWKNGIHWITEDGTQAMVQVTEENRAVSLSLSFNRACPTESLLLRSSLIDRILSKLKELCSSVDFSEYLVSPSQVCLISHSNFSKLTIFEMKDVAKRMLLHKEFIFDKNRKVKISLQSLVFSDPYRVLPSRLVQQLFATDKSSELVPEKLLKIIRHHSGDISFTANSTHQSLRERLNKFSVFAGRNPLELAGVSTDELPHSPLLDSVEDAPDTSTTPTPSVSPTASPERDLPAMAVFHHYYDYLATSVHDSVSLASNVCSKRLLNREGRDQVVTTQTTIPLHQSLTFLGAVESRIAPEDNSRSLTEFCQAPETSPGLRVVTEEMRKDLVDLDPWCLPDGDSPADMHAEEQQPYLSGVADLTPSPTMGSSTEILPEGALDSSHLADLFESLRDLRDWKKLGMFLGISYPTLEKIELDKHGVDNCKMAVFYHWLCSGTANKQILLAALSKMGESLQGRMN